MLLVAFSLNSNAATGVRKLNLGDSYVQGFCVPTSENFVSKVRDSYPETINVGVAASAPLNNLARLREYGSPYTPKLVIWGHYENDPDSLFLGNGLHYSIEGNHSVAEQVKDWIKKREQRGLSIEARHLHMHAAIHANSLTSDIRR